MALIVASNRLPVVVDGDALRPAAGGLVSAMEPIMRERGGTWVGWPGTGKPIDDLLTGFNASQPFALAPVMLTDEQVERYYYGFSNRTLWPLFHDLLGYCDFNREHWEAYEDVNRRFAREVAERVRPGDTVWIHDYHLTLVARELRALGVEARIGWFLHTPFPSADLFRRLPWRDAIVRALVDYDLTAFHTLRDRRNFVQTVRELCEGSTADIRRRLTHLTVGERTVRVGNFPIGIDYRRYNEAAASVEVAQAAWYLHEKMPERQLVLGIDRLDYTKGIPNRFEAFERMLEKYPEAAERVTLVQVVVPSRTRVPDYRDLKSVLDEMAGRINARFATAGWRPIYYVYRSLSQTDLLAHYRACEIALITPLRDGMNLVAKEYCAASVEDNGVLVLSEFAGAADQLGRDALLVNPYDIEATADTIHRALTMPQEERRRRMAALRAEVRRNNVFRWVEQFLGALTD